ncbi:hypothetical protein [Spirillospora sp. NPDC047279]|uniref:hypothetical protein n=1 Tax=Spirillospora sp. NPDC047279 TaxID=3155478 RepID=UPI0033CFD41D
MSDAEPLSSRDYELFILHTMVDAPDDLVEETLRRVEAGREDMEASRRRIEEQNYIMRPAFDELSALFAPSLREEHREADGQPLLVRTFPLQIWSDFFLEIHGTPGGLIWDERFVRADGTPSPRIDAPSQLRAWLMTKDEVEERFGALEEVELWSPYAAYSFNHPAPDGQGEQTHIVTFSRSLLQSAKPVRS